MPSADIYSITALIAELRGPAARLSSYENHHDISKIARLPSLTARYPLPLTVELELYQAGTEIMKGRNIRRE